MKNKKKGRESLENILEAAYEVASVGNGRYFILKNLHKSQVKLSLL